jgi:mono/diheme cytochrome c family protein
MPERPPDPVLEESTTRWMAWGLAIMVVMVLIFPFYRIWEPSAREDARALQQESLAEQGSAIYGLNCASCHGVDGEGGIGPALRSEQFLTGAVDNQIESLIAVGVPGSQMSAYSLDFGGPLTSEQIEAVTVFLRSWEEDAPVESHSSASSSTKPPPMWCAFSEHPIHESGCGFARMWAVSSTVGDHATAW